ncbi:hypothetical protein [Aporhodopirellula aestuarii]|uniref:Terminase small subunit n=1 Tax=Aporhodopirellula aestuarii TaxID=2950107 RepID=A0ABT0U218_9BACT|nr:hypothetical protein [Aporhodopirellula aestuarii]MCM2370933.1 hypothetical protein [Aporhodopirellula aestuarii]
MARKPKTPEPVSREAIAAAAVRLEMILRTFKECTEELDAGESLQVNYSQSLGRGLDALESFEPELRISLAMHRAGTPVQPVEPSPDEQTILDGHDDITDAVASRRRKKAAQPKATRKGTKKRDAK